jgi:hypothetical protein
MLYLNNINLQFNTEIQHSSGANVLDTCTDEHNTGFRPSQIVNACNCKYITCYNSYLKNLLLKYIFCLCEICWVQPESFTLLPYFLTVIHNISCKMCTHRIKGFSDFVHHPDSKKLEDRWWTKAENPLILCVIHHRQNPIESMCTHVYNLSKYLVSHV